MLIVTRLQNGWSCQVKLPIGWAEAGAGASRPAAAARITPKTRDAVGRAGNPCMVGHLEPPGKDGGSLHMAKAAGDSAHLTSRAVHFEVSRASIAARRCTRAAFSAVSRST